MVTAGFSIIKKYAVLAVFCFGVPQAAAAFDYKQLLANIMTWHGIEHSRRLYEVHQIYRSDINGDGITDEAIVLTWHGATRGQSGNAIMALVSHADGEHVAGGDGNWVMLEPVKINGFIENVSFDRNLMVVAYLALGPSDPACCPSVREQQFFQWTGSRMGFQQVIE